MNIGTFLKYARRSKKSGKSPECNAGICRSWFLRAQSEEMEAKVN
jgi:hypothetical protein